MFVNQHENRSSTGGSAGEEGLYYGTNTWGGGGQTEGTSRGSQRRGHGGGWRGAMPAPPLQAFPTGRDGTAQPSPPGARARARARARRDRGREAPPPAKRRAAASRAEPSRTERPPPGCARPPPPPSPPPALPSRPASRRHPASCPTSASARRRPGPVPVPAPPPPRGRGPGRAVQPRRPLPAPPGKGGLRAVPHGLCGHVSAAAARCGRPGRNRAQALKGDKAAIATIASSAAILAEGG